MREIKFRGKSEIDSVELLEKGIRNKGGWVYGTFIDGFIISGVIEANSEYIAIEQWTPVHRKSVGQYTGLKDKDEKEIYEGDVVRRIYKSGNPFVGEVILEEATYFIRNGEEYSFLANQYDSENLEVIGNIYTNPELLNGDEND